MKPRLVATACCLFSMSSAYAQSSVTVSGILDAGITSLSNASGKHLVSMDTGILSPNLWGIRGSEVLDSDLKAIFTLEGQMAIDTGQSIGSLFGRQAWVGLASSQWGSITAGNQYDFMFTSLTAARLGEQMRTTSLQFFRQGPFDALGKPAMPSGSFDFDRTAGAERIPNSLRYQSAASGGLQVGALYGFGEQAGAFANQSAQSFGIDYAQQNWSINAAYAMVKYAAINDGIRNFGVGGRATLGQTSTDLLYTNTRNTFNGGAVNVIEAGASQLLSPVTVLALQYAFMQGNQVLRNNRASQFNLLLDYSLSKRTDVYASAAWQHASGDANDASAWILGTGSASSGGRQVALRMGIRHFF